MATIVPFGECWGLKGYWVRVPEMTLAERIERQERANAAVNMETFAAYTARRAAGRANYVANAAAIDAQIARDDAELDTGDAE